MNSPHDPRLASTYFETQVRTASQPRLQMMLLDGALRAVRQAVSQIEDAGDWQTAGLQLAKAAEITEGLVQSAAQGSEALSKRFEEEYAFLYRELTAARINQDSAKVKTVQQLLEYQRETWRLVCDNLAQQGAGDGGNVEAEQPHEASRHPVMPPPVSPIISQLDTSGPLAGGGLSLEA